ncbi:MAG: hypothetical protein K2X27_17180 [Candidatus Obscuribacterales bacterium]|nr:hypothetical protein [Candidatus Obscuribacterales bacterium]
MSRTRERGLYQKPGLALALSIGLLLGSLVNASADEVDSWIEETGSHKAETQNKVEQIQQSLESKNSALKTETEAALKPTPSPEKKLAVAMPPAVSPASANTAPQAQSSAPLLKGGVTYCVPSGTPLKLKLATVPMPEIKMEMRDMEGNLRPAQLDEVITARITEDIFVDDNKVIPEGTVFHGKVSKIIAPRHVGRAGHLELSFDKFTTPDGRTFAFKAEANNFKESTMKSKAKGAGAIAAHAAGGAALGALVAYKLFGPQNTIAMHGYNIAGGAAVGAVGGIAWALWRRGPHAVLEPGDEFAMSIDTDLLIPAATAPTVKAPPKSIPGFEMDVISKKITKDGLGGHMLRLESFISNHSNRKLNSIDLFLEDDLGNRCPITADTDEDAQDLFFVQPLSRQKIVCTFAIQYPKLKHKLIWLDHHSHNIIFEQKI